MILSSLERSRKRRKRQEEYEIYLYGQEQKDFMNQIMKNMKNEEKKNERFK